VTPPVTTTDSCFQILGEEMVPECTMSVCSESCCQSLLFPFFGGCSTGWSLTFIYHMLTYLQQQTKLGCACEIPVQIPCIFNAQTPSSPCQSPACSSVFLGKGITLACLEAVTDYCKVEGGADAGCVWFVDRLASCPTTLAQWYMCAVREEDSLILQTYTNYSKLTKGTGRTFLSWDGISWLNSYAMVDTVYSITKYDSSGLGVEYQRMVTQNTPPANFNPSPLFVFVLVFLVVSALAAEIPYTS
jgi:hypothetical protein